MKEVVTVSNTLDKVDLDISTGIDEADPEVLAVIDEIELLVEDAAQHLDEHGYPCRPEWHYHLVVVVEPQASDAHEVHAWTVVPRAGHQPAVSVSHTGELVIESSVKRVGHVLTRGELVTAGLELVRQIEAGLRWLIKRQHPQDLVSD